MKQHLEFRASPVSSTLVGFGLGLMGLSLATSAGASSDAENTLVGHELFTSRGVAAGDMLLAQHIAAATPILAQAVRFLGPARVADRPVVAASELVQRVHLDSGLTWEQLARLFGVSRRSLHLWASGGRLNAANEEFLVELSSVVSIIPGDTPNERRAALLKPQADGRSIFDQMRSRHGARATDINREPLTPEQVLESAPEASRG